MAAGEDSNSILAPALLLGAAIAGLLLSNSPFASSYQGLLDSKIGLNFGSYELLNKSLLLLINDGLMAIFFLFVGLELKREILVGELSSLKKAMLPLFAAVGGMLLPALFYYLANPSGEQANGWGIPMATDIAFALGIIAILGKRVPMALKVMLVAIAIVDDLGAISVIAFFYTDSVSISYLMYSFAALAVAVGLNLFNVQKLSLYLLIGIPLWYFMLKSGVHATIAGVALAFTIPLTQKGSNRSLVLQEILDGKRNVLDSPAVFLEKSLYKWIGYAIVPIFAIANSTVTFAGMEPTTISLGIVLGLVVGKPLGVLAFSFLACKLNLGSLPPNISWTQIAGVGCLAGIGFTMSLFVNSLAFENPAFQTEAKIAILGASFLSAIYGIGVLVYANKKA